MELHTLYFYNILFYEISINFHTKKINEVILLPRKLYKTQTEIITRDARSFTRNNHNKSCRLPVSGMHKLGWQEKLLKNSAAPIIVIVDSIATGLRGYRHIWRNYFKNVLNLGISGDRAENVLWRARDISLRHTTLYNIAQIMWTKVNQKILPLEP